MNQIYRYCGLSKQAFHQKMDRQLVDREQQLLLLPIIAELRQEHPGVGARELYTILKPTGLGRDKFEQLCFRNGYKLSQKRAFTRTTDSTGVIRFPNLVAGLELTSISQVWVSDITYYEIGNKFYYLTFVMDLFSRFIIGYSISQRLLTLDTTLPALVCAIKNRRPSAGLIFHSDGGGQYYSKDFLALTSKYNIHNSMCEMAYENPNAERVNGTIKNQYLKGYGPKNYSELIKMTEKAIFNYNFVRPHRSLNRQSPAVFEKNIPAGGSSSRNDAFFSLRNSDQLQNKKHHSLKRLPYKERIDKTVNVFQA